MFIFIDKYMVIYIENVVCFDGNDVLFCFKMELLNLVLVYVY